MGKRSYAKGAKMKNARKSYDENRNSIDMTVAIGTEHGIRDDRYEETSESTAFDRAATIACFIVIAFAAIYFAAHVLLAVIGSTAPAAPLVLFAVAFTCVGIFSVSGALSSMR